MSNPRPVEETPKPRSPGHRTRRGQTMASPDWARPDQDTKHAPAWGAEASGTDKALSRSSYFGADGAHCVDELRAFKDATRVFSLSNAALSARE
jgi:hypothetical protein